MEGFIKTLMETIFNDSAIVHGAIKDINIAAKVIKNKLQRRKTKLPQNQEETNDAAKMAETKKLDDLSKNTKRNSQYKTKARTILFHLISCIIDKKYDYLQLEYRDLNLPRYDGVEVSILKERLKLNIFNRDIYDREISKSKKRALDSDYDFYWTMQHAIIISEYGKFIIPHLYERVQSTLANDKTETFNKKDDPTRQSKDITEIREGEVVAKLMIALLCEFDLLTILEHVDEQLKRRMHTPFSTSKFLEHMMDLLYAVGDGISNNIEKERTRRELIERKYHNVCEVLYYAAKRQKYRIYHPENVMNDDYNHEALDISMFQSMSKCTQNCYCYESGKKLDLEKRKIQCTLRSNMTQISINVIMFNNAGNVIFDVMDLPFPMDSRGMTSKYSDINWKKFSWYQRLEHFELFIKNEASPDNQNITTILHDLKRIDPIHILYDNFMVAQDLHIYIRTSSLGLGTLFVKNCNNTGKPRSRKKRRNRKVKIEDLNKTEIQIQGLPLLSEMNMNQDNIEFYNPRQDNHIEAVLPMARSIYTNVETIRDMEPRSVMPAIFDEEDAEFEGLF